jgi:hypothetical protein
LPKNNPVATGYLTLNLTSDPAGLTKGIRITRDSVTSSGNGECYVFFGAN